MKTFTLCVAALVAAVTLTSVAAARPGSRSATDFAYGKLHVQTTFFASEGKRGSF